MNGLFLALADAYAMVPRYSRYSCEWYRSNPLLINSFGNETAMSNCMKLSDTGNRFTLTLLISTTELSIGPLGVVVKTNEEIPHRANPADMWYACLPGPVTRG